MRTSVSESLARDLLTHGRIALVGVSADDAGFGTTIYRALRDHGSDVVPVGRRRADLDGVTVYPDLTSVPGTVDSVIVMVPAGAAVEVVREAIARGIPRVWLFKGIGGPGAVSYEALELCREAGVDVIAGACPLMFLDPVASVHRLHRIIRRARGALRAA
jgi:predicted CoA-binding protein